VLQAEGVVGCRRLIIAAASTTGVALLAVAVPAAFTPLALRDDDDAPAGSIAGTRVRSIGGEAGGKRERMRKEKGENFLLLLLLPRSIGRGVNPALLRLLFFCLSLSWFYIKPFQRAAATPRGSKNCQHGRRDEEEPSPV
jgi:hypothetical protein